MITQPTCPQLINAIRVTLREQIAPALEEKNLQSTLGMVDFLLDNVAQRCEHEAIWMGEEIAAIEKVARRLLESGVDTDGRIARAQGELVNGRSDGALDLAGDYKRASELLSVCLEAKLDPGSELRTLVESLLYARIARESEIRGEFALVGRT